MDAGTGQKLALCTFIVHVLVFKPCLYITYVKTKLDKQILYGICFTDGLKTPILPGYLSGIFHTYKKDFYKKIIRSLKVETELLKYNVSRNAELYFSH